MSEKTVNCENAAANAKKINNITGKTIVGIDVGGSTTKIVGFAPDGGLISPIFVRATDPVTSVYGALGRFTSENRLSLGDIDRVMITGAGSGFVPLPIYSLPCREVTEFKSIGLGGLYLSGLDEAIVVSMGTGTALIHAKREAEGATTEYLGGTGVGGGTLVGLSKELLGMDEIEHIEQLCEGGDLSRVDLRVKEISREGQFSGLNDNLTASNFGRVSDLASKSDIALGIVNMVAETVAMLSIFAARGFGLKNIVLTGNLTRIAPVRRTFEGLSAPFGVDFIIPELSQYGTVIGAALQ